MEAQAQVPARLLDPSRDPVHLRAVAVVEPDGLVKARQQSGEAAVMARHMGFVAVFRAMVPHGPQLAAIPDFTPNNTIDELTVPKWKKLGLRPSAPKTAFASSIHVCAPPEPMLKRPPALL